MTEISRRGEWRKTITLMYYNRVRFVAIIIIYLGLITSLQGDRYILVSHYAILVGEFYLPSGREPRRNKLREINGDPIFHAIVVDD